MNIMGTSSSVFHCPEESSDTFYGADTKWCLETGNDQICLFCLQTTKKSQKNKEKNLILSSSLVRL